MLKKKLSLISEYALSSSPPVGFCLKAIILSSVFLPIPFMAISLSEEHSSSSDNCRIPFRTSMLIALVERFVEDKHKSDILFTISLIFRLQ